MGRQQYDINQYHHNGCGFNTWIHPFLVSITKVSRKNSVVANSAITPIFSLCNSLLHKSVKIKIAPFLVNTFTHWQIVPLKSPYFFLFLAVEKRCQRTPNFFQNKAYTDKGAFCISIHFLISLRREINSASLPFRPPKYC